MREAKITTIILFIIFIISIVLSFLLYDTDNNLYNISISIFTGSFVSLVMAISQYFIKKNEIKNNIFDLYFKVYCAIYVSEQRRILFHHNVTNVFKAIQKMNDELLNELSKYSSFIPNNSFYKRLNPIVSLDLETFNGENIMKLLLPINHKRFNKIIGSFKMVLKDAMIKIDRKKFSKKFDEYEKMYTLMWK